MTVQLPQVIEVWAVCNNGAAGSCAHAQLTVAGRRSAMSTLLAATTLLTSSRCCCNFEMAAKTGRPLAQWDDMLPAASTHSVRAERSSGLPQPCLAVASWKALPASTLLHLWPLLFTLHDQGAALHPGCVHDWSVETPRLCTTAGAASRVWDELAFGAHAGHPGASRGAGSHS